MPARAFGGIAKAIDRMLAPRAEGERSALSKFFRSIGVTLYVWGTWTKGKFIRDGYCGNSTVYSVVTSITKTCAVAPFRVYRVKNKQKALRYKHWTGANATDASRQKAMMIKEQAFEEDLEHPFNDIIKKPNRWQGWDEFVQTCIGFRLITGNRFLFELSLTEGANAGKLISLYNLPPQHMTILATTTMWAVTGYEMQCGEIVKFPAEVITHSRYWNPNYDGAGTHLWGLAPLEAGRKDLDRSNKAAQRGVTVLENAGAAGVLFEKGNSWADLSPEQAAELKRKINEEVLGSDNAGKIALANGDIGYHNFGQTTVEMDIVNQEKYSDEKIANIFTYPAGLLQANANATDNNIKAWNRQKVTNCCIPELSALRDDLNNIAQKYYPDDAVFVDYDLSVYPELQEDQEKIAKIMSSAWWLKGNEKRLAMSYDEDTAEPMMDTYLVPTSVQPINNINPDALVDEAAAALADSPVGG